MLGNIITGLFLLCVSNDCALIILPASVELLVMSLSSQSDALPHHKTKLLTNTMQSTMLSSCRQILTP